MRQEKVRSFSRLDPRRSTLERDSVLLATPENVGSQFLSLRQEVQRLFEVSLAGGRGTGIQHSPV
jgi:hypothetical protein